MSRFESIAGTLFKNVSSGSTHSGLAGEVLDMVGGARGSGLAGLMRAFEGQGLGHVMQSWIGTGGNLPVSAEQIAQVFGSGRLGQLGAQFGIAPEQAASQIAQILPQIVDGLTPHGSVPDSDLLQEGLSFLRSRLS